MGYKKGSSILPDELIKQIQKYVDGECIYIPRISGKRRKWGENTDFRNLLEERNAKIYSGYQSGVSVKQLAEEYHISPQGIYKIIAKYKK